MSTSPTTIETAQAAPDGRETVDDLRKRHARSGTRLIVYDSLIEYLRSETGKEGQRQP